MPYVRVVVELCDWPSLSHICEWTGVRHRRLHPRFPRKIAPYPFWDNESRGLSISAGRNSLYYLPQRSYLWLRWAVPESAPRDRQAGRLTSNLAESDVEMVELVAGITTVEQGGRFCVCVHAGAFGAAVGTQECFGHKAFRVERALAVHTVPPDDLGGRRATATPLHASGIDTLTREGPLLFPWPAHNITHRCSPSTRESRQRGCRGT